MGLWGERATILGASSDRDEMYISNWLMIKFLSYILNSRLTITELIITEYFSTYGKISKLAVL